MASILFYINKLSNQFYYLSRMLNNYSKKHDLDFSTIFKQTSDFFL